MSFKLDAADLTPEKLAEFQQAQQKVGSALGRLIAVAEQYPDLKANQNFLELQAQLEGTENGSPWPAHASTMRPGSIT